MTVLVVGLDSVTVNEAVVTPPVPSRTLVSVTEMVGTAACGCRRFSISLRIRASTPVNSCSGEGGRCLIPNSERNFDRMSDGRIAATAVCRTGVTAAVGTDTVASPGSAAAAETGTAGAELAGPAVRSGADSVDAAGLVLSEVTTRASRRLGTSGRDTDGVRAGLLGAPDLAADGASSPRRDEPTEVFDGFDGWAAEPLSGVSATATPGWVATARPRPSANAAEPNRYPKAVEFMAPP